MRRPKPHPTPRPRAPTPLSMRKHTGTHTCDVWSKRTGDGGLEETLANKTIKPPQPAPFAALPVAKNKNPTTANQSPSPRPPLQQPTPSRMHPSKPIAGIGADSVGVREGDRAGIRSHKSVNNLSQKKGVEGHAKHAQKPHARLTTTAQWSCANPLGGCGKVQASRYE